MRPFIYCLIALSVAVLSACECEEISLIEEETLSDPDNFLAFQVTDIALLDQNVIDTDFDEIRIRFNRPVEIKSFELEVTIVLSGENLLFDGVFVDQVLPNVVALPLCQRIICTDFPCTIQIELREAGSKAILSANQLVLDGDYDGEAGGNYQAELLMQEAGC